MTFVIFDCIYDTDLILVSILAKSRSMISKKTKINYYMTLTVDLQIQGQVDYCMSFFIFDCMYDKD